MKKILLFLFLLLVPNFVCAEDIQIDKLNILNGELSLNFDPLNTEYSVYLEPTEFNLDFDYQVKPGIVVSINNNSDLENNSMVTLTITKETTKIDYHFYIIKEEPTTEVFNYNIEENVNENFMFKYKLYIIPSTCLVLIIFSYKIIFRKHKNKII